MHFDAPLRAALAATSVLVALATACGAPADPQPTGSTQEGATTCKLKKCNPPTPPILPPHTGTGVDDGSDSGASFPISAETGPVCVSPDDPTCSATEVDVPLVLAGQGCLPGIVTYFGGAPRYVFACPAATPVPTAPFGYANQYQGEAAHSSTDYCDACVGAPLDGWVLIIDEVVNTPPAGCRGSCPGGQ